MKKIVSITLILSLSLMLSGGPAFSQDKLNPDFAATLSLLFPGLGQIYAGDTTRGLIFLGSEIVIFAVGSGLIQAALKDPIRESFAERGIQIVGKDGKTYTVFAVPSREEMKKRFEEFFTNLDGGQVAMLTTGGILIFVGIGFHIFGAIDAHGLANK